MDIAKILPEINLISEKSLKEKVVKIFEKAIDEGKWIDSDLENIPFTLLIPELINKNTLKPKITLIDHIRAVTNLVNATYNIYNNLGLVDSLNKNELIAGGLLHDIGKFLEYEKDKNGKIQQSHSGTVLRHPAQGLEVVSEFKLPLAVRQAIIFHSKEGDQINRLPEVEIISRCDFLCFIPVKKLLQQ
ncbi:MAG: HD domain-containing protein [Candidatus Thorarchaeota archaeon]